MFFINLLLFVSLSAYIYASTISVPEICKASYWYINAFCHSSFLPPLHPSDRRVNEAQEEKAQQVKDPNITVSKYPPTPSSAARSFRYSLSSTIYPPAALNPKYTRTEIFSLALSNRASVVKEKETKAPTSSILSEREQFASSK